MDDAAPGAEVHDIATPDTPVGAQQQAPTLQEIATMFRQEVTPLKRAISDLEHKVTGMGDMMDSRMSAVEGKMDNLETRIVDLEKQNASMTNTPRSDGTVNAEIWEQLRALELQIATLKVSDPISANDKAEKDKTLVIGGLQSFGGVEEAKEWASNKLWDAFGPQPQDTYAKGDFRGIVFMKFLFTMDRDAAVNIFRKGSFKEGGNNVWAKPDKFLSERILSSFVFGVKRMFIKDWGYETKAVWADPEEGKVWVGTDLAVHGNVEGGKLSVVYGPGWKEWLTDPAFPEYTTHVAKLSSKLENVPAKGGGKAAFKGKAKGGKGTGPHRK